MEIFCQYPESHPFESDFQSLNLPKTPPISDASSCGSTISGEEFLLESCHPKRRSGRKKFRETRHPVYRGVRQRNGNKWVCELREPNKKSRIWLGTFQTAEMAARAHDVAALALRGRSACLNFADSAWRLPVPVSANAKDIQKAAAEAAESFRPSISEEISCDTVTSSNSEEMCCDTVTSSNSNGMFCNTERTENATMSPETFFYMDEETVFEMPSLLANMAEGLLLSPPPRYYWDDLEIYADVSLWSYSN